MSVSCADGNGSYGTYHIYKLIPNRIPAEERAALLKGCIGSGVQQRLWVNHTHASEEVLRMIRVNNVFSDAHACALTILILPHKILERVAKPGLVAVPEGIFARGIAHGYDLHGVK
jgi:hypothetical protein